MIGLAMYFGNTISMASIFTTLMMIDWLHWPMHMLPHFFENVRRTRRDMKRIQKFLLVDEIQQDLVVEEEKMWGRPALEIKGNFTWGLVSKQEDEDSEEEEERLAKEEKEKKKKEKLERLEAEEKAKEEAEAKLKKASGDAEPEESKDVAKEEPTKVEAEEESKEKKDEEKTKEEKEKEEKEKEKEKPKTIASKINLKGIELEVK